MNESPTARADYYLGETYGNLYVTSTYHYIGAPINLPNGAKVTKVTLFFIDPGASKIDLYVKRTNLYNGIGTSNFAMSTIGSAAGIRNQSDSGYMKINNSGYEHVVYLWLPFDPAYRVFGVKIIYTP